MSTVHDVSVLCITSAAIINQNVAICKGVDTLLTYKWPQTNAFAFSSHFSCPTFLPPLISH